MAQTGKEKLPDGSEILQVDASPLVIYSAAAIQELHRSLQDKQEMITALGRAKTEVQEKLARQKEITSRMDARIAALETVIAGMSENAKAVASNKQTRGSE